MKSMKTGLVLVIVLVSGACLASQVFLQSVTLKDLVKRSSYILVVEPADPPSRTVTIKTPGTPKRGKTCPDFTVHISRLVVKEVLRPAGKPKIIGKTLEVLQADVEHDLYLHRKYYMEGTSKSPIVPRYLPRVVKNEQKQEKTFIVFLNESGSSEKDFKSMSTWRFAVSGARETMGMKKKVLELINKK